MSEQLPTMLTVSEVADYLRIGRNEAYELVRTGQIRSVKLGRSIRVPRVDLPGSPDELRSLRPNPLVPNERFALLYRCFGIDDELLYVGTTMHGARRMMSHAEKGWFEREVLIMTFERVPVRDAALMEMTVIEREQPRYNVVHNGRAKHQRLSGSSQPGTETSPLFPQVS